MTLNLPRTAAMIVAAVTALAGLVMAGPAQAGTTDGHHHLRPEVFTLFMSSNVPQGDVNAFGPVHGRHGTDTQVSDTLDVFNFRAGSVNVYHSPPPTSAPKIDYRACTATQFQKGHWRFAGGTGKYRHAIGWGHFKLKFFAVLKRVNHKCDTNPNHEPKYFQVVVIASGVAAR